MDLRKLAGEVAKYAPSLGAAIAGPPGALVGGLVKSVATAFGLEPDSDPETIMTAIKSNPDAAVKLAQIQSDERVKIQQINADKAVQIFQSETTRLAAVNTTMQAESKSEHWAQWSWRPFWGFISATAFLAVCVFVSVIAYKAVVMKDGAAVGNIPMIIGAFTTLFSIPGAILGITAWGRNNLKVKSILADNMRRDDL